MDVTTKARVQAILASGGQQTAPLDALIPVLIADVSARFERYVGRKFEQTSRTERFDADPTISRFFLDAYPVASVARVEYDPDRDFGSTGEVLTENDDFVTDAECGIVFLEGFVQSRPYRQAWEVEYTGGLAANVAALVTAYPELAHAADLQVAYLARRRQSLGGSATAAGAGSATYVGAYELLPEVKAILDLFRRRGF